MEINTKIDLSDADQQELARILDCSVDGLSTALSAYSSAALNEYVSMFLGQKISRRGSDINEYRLFLLITTVFGNMIPDEQEVCRLFQTSATESRALIRAVMSKFQYQLRGAIDNSIRKSLESAQKEGDTGPYVVTINSQNVVEELNRSLATIDGSLQQIKKKRGSVSTFEISPSAYARLTEKFIKNE